MAQIMRDPQIMRNAPTEVDFGGQGGVAAPDSSAPFVSPQYAAFDGKNGRVKVATDAPTPSVSDQLITSLLPAGQAWADNKLKQSQTEAYLSGEAAAASGKAKDEVEGNIFTKNWAQAGWQDTKARLGLADAVAQTSIDIKQKLREQDPSAMQDYLQNRRNQLVPLMDGMSTDAKKGYMAQLVMSDRQAIAEQAVAHQKFIIDAQSQAVTTGFAVQNDAMNAAKADPAAYQTATQAALANVYGSIWQNPNLPIENKRAMVTQAAQLALDNGNLPFYEQLKNAKLPGQTASMIDNLPFDDQIKLAKGYTDAQQKNLAMSNGAYISSLGLYEARLNNPNAQPVTWAEHQSMMQEGVQRNVIDAGKLEALNKEWATSQSKIQDDTRAAAYFQAGNVNGLFSLNKDSSEGAQAWLKMQTRMGVDPAQATVALANIGLSTGQDAAFKAVGTLMASSVAQLRSGNDKIDPGQLAGLNAIMSTIDTAEAKGNTSARSAFLSSFSPDDAALITDYRSKLRANGGNSLVAAQDAATDEINNKKLTPQDRDALGQLNAKDNAAIVSDLTPKGVFARAWDGVVPDMFRSRSSISLDAIRANRGGIGDGTGGAASAWKEDPERVEAAMAPVRMRVLQELHTIDQSRPYLSKDDKTALALSNVARATVDTAGGPLVVPQGLTPQQFFGTPANMGVDVIGSALNTMHEPAKGNRMVYSITSAGQVQWQEWGPRDPGNPNPSIVGSGVFDPKTVGPAASAQLDRRVEEFNKVSGSGTTATGSDGSTVTYSGANTIGIADNVAYNIRKDLVKYEEVRMKPYNGPTTDAQGNKGSGIDTVGVGVAKTSQFYPPIEADGTVLPSNINKSFMLASNDAMTKANEAAQDLPQQYRNVDSMRLFTQLAYQHGSVYPDVVKAMASGDKQAAVAALQASSAYKGAHAERRAFYDQLMDRIMFNQPQ